MAKSGFQGKLYYNTGTYATPTWNEVTIVGDLSYTMTKDKTDASVRGGGRVRQYAGTMADLSISGKMRADVNHEDFIKFDDAFHDNTQLDIMVLNGPSDENGVTGYRFYAEIFSWQEDQAMSAVIYQDFELAPGVPATEAEVPKRVVVTGGSPTFEAFS